MMFCFIFPTAFTRPNGWPAARLKVWHVWQKRVNASGPWCWPFGILVPFKLIIAGCAVDTICPCADWWAEIRPGAPIWRGCKTGCYRCRLCLWLYILMNCVS